MATTTPESDIYKLKLETTFDEDNNTIHITSTLDLEVGQEESEILTKWTRIRDIGVGGFGAVWLEEAQGGQLRAVKRLPQVAGKADWSRELRILAQLRNHKTLFVQFLGWYEHKDFVFFAMEYLEHGDLDKYLKTFGPKAKSEAKGIVTQLLEGLIILHKQNICHRDIKPKNILIASISPIRIKIADFGLSKDQNGTSLRTKCGSSGYLAPELQGFTFPQRKFKKGSYTNSVDIWSLGILTHETLTSEIPFLLPDDSDSELESGLKPKAEREPEPPVIDMGLLSDYCRGDQSFPVGSLQKSGVSDEGIEFVVMLLVADPRSRISAEEALKSRWLISESQEPYYSKKSGRQEQRLAQADSLTKVFKLRKGRLQRKRLERGRLEEHQFELEEGRLWRELIERVQPRGVRIEKELPREARRVEKELPRGAGRVVEEKPLGQRKDRLKRESKPIITSQPIGFSHTKRAPDQKFYRQIPNIDLREQKRFFYDIKTVASTLREFFRDKDLIIASNIDDDITRRDMIHEVINKLPDQNYAALRASILYLYHVQKTYDINKTNTRKSAACLGPVLLSSGSPNTVDEGWQVRVVDTILQYYYYIFVENQRTIIGCETSRGDNATYMHENANSKSVRTEIPIPKITDRSRLGQGGRTGYRVSSLVYSLLKR